MESRNASIKVRWESVRALSVCERHVLKLGQTPCGGIFLLIYQPLSLLSLWLLLFAQPTIKTVNQSRARILQWTITFSYREADYLRLGTACRHIVAEKSKSTEHKTSTTFHKKSQRAVWRVNPGVSRILTAERRSLQKLIWTSNEYTVIVNKRWADCVCLCCHCICIIYYTIQQNTWF